MLFGWFISTTLLHNAMQMFGTFFLRHPVFTYQKGVSSLYSVHGRALVSSVWCWSLRLATASSLMCDWGLFLCLYHAILHGRKRNSVFNVSVRPFVRLLPNLWSQYFGKKEWPDFDANWHKARAWNNHVAVQEVKDQGHVRPKSYDRSSFSTALGSSSCNFFGLRELSCILKIAQINDLQRYTLGN